MPATETQEHALILNVDDYDAARYASSRVLRQAGFEVLEAATGEAALSLMTEQPDLVILDVNLPDIDGFEVCRRIKEDPRTATTPVLYLSAAYRGAEHRVRGLDLGADGYLTQPVEPRELVATVHALLRARRVEEAVRRSEERFRSLVVATAQVVFTTDADGCVTGELPTWQRITGQKPEDVLGFGWLDGIHAEDRARVEATWREALAAGTLFEAEYRVRLADGSWHYFSGRAVPVREKDGTIREWVGAHTDIDERRRAEEYQRLLSEAGALLSASLEYEVTLDRVARLAVPVLADWCAVDLLDEAGAVQRVAVTGRDADGISVAQRAGDAAAPVTPAAAAWRVIRSGQAEFLPDLGEGELAAATTEPEHLRALRELGVHALIVVPLQARGAVLGALSLAARSRRRYGAAELSTAEELARRAAMAVDNARLYGAALLASQAKSDFLAVMSHELRTPLNAIIGYADLLRARISGPLNEVQEEHLGRVVASAHHLLEIINDILTFSRVEAGVEEVHASDLDLGEIVRETAALLEPLAAKKGLAFAVRVPQGAMPFRTDAGKLRQILLNLLSNAVKFTDAGSVEVGLELAEDDVVIEVSDTGIGIAGDEQERIFDPFRQVEQGASRRAGGTGLGLSVTRHLVRLLGGDVLVRSTLGQGSTFTVRLPSLAVAAPAGAAL